MSKIITSNSKTWPGTVTIFDRLVLSQVELVEAALNENPVFVERTVTNKEGKTEIRQGVSKTSLDKPRLPALLACVEKWELKDFPENVTVDTFPMTPRREAHNLIMQIFAEIALVYNGEMEVPNG